MNEVGPEVQEMMAASLDEKTCKRMEEMQTALQSDPWQGGD